MLLLFRTAVEINFMEIEMEKKKITLKNFIQWRFLSVLCEAL